MEKQKTIFDFINDITYRKVRWEDQPEVDRKRFQPYMINRWLSMHPEYLEIVAEVQPTISRLSSREFYNFFTDLLPSRKFFTKYVKSAAANTKNDELIAFVAEKLMVGKRGAIDIINLSSIDDLKQFIQEYGYSTQEIKKQFGI